MGFKLSSHSLGQLVGVYPELSYVATEAIQISKVDFIIFDGVRNLKQQQEMVATGASKTLKSYHLEGLALDLVPWINGGPRWDHGACVQINDAVQQVARSIGLDVDWGYQMWWWDSVHFQCTELRGIYDVRKLRHDLECVA